MVASTVGGMRELIDETNGRLVEPEDVAALAEALTSVLGTAPQQRPSAQPAGRGWIAERRSRSTRRASCGSRRWFAAFP